MATEEESEKLRGKQEFKKSTSFRTNRHKDINTYINQ